MKILPLAFALAFLVVAPALAAEHELAVVSGDLVNSSSFAVKLSDGETLRAQAREIKTRSGSTGGLVTTWRGTLEGVPGSSVTMTALSNLEGVYTAGVIEAGDRAWSVRSDRSGKRLVEEIDRSEPLKCDEVVHAHEEAPLQQASGELATISTNLSAVFAEIDLLVLYTDDARVAAGGEGPLAAEIENAVDRANEGFSNSQLTGISIRIAHMQEVPYDETAPGRETGDFTYLFSSPVQNLLDQYRADLPVLIPEQVPDACGRGSLNDGSGSRFLVSVAARNCIRGRVLFHEIGHNLGLRHNPEVNDLPAPIGAPDVGYGHNWCPPDSPNGLGYMDTMSYPMPGPVCTFGHSSLNLLSNPEVFHEGFPTGTPSRNAALVASIFAPKVAAFSSHPPGTGEWLMTSSLPGWAVKVRIAGERDGVQEPCLDETLCASGALPGRVEALVRVIGPRPNGFYWVNIVRFTVVRVEVWVWQLSTDVVRFYDLPGVSVDSDELPGLVDREAFRP